MAETNKFLDGTGLSQVWDAAKDTFVEQEEGKGLSTNDYDAEAKAKVDGVEEGAEVNVIESISVNGVAQAVNEKGVNITLPDTYTKEETDNAIKAAVSTVYKLKGTVAFAALPTEEMEAGDTYNISDAFTTTDAFVEGAGKAYPAGTNVAYTADGKWDCLAGTYDFSEYVKASDITSLSAKEIAAICV